jgi:SPW repeat
MAARVSSPSYQWPNWLNLILAVWLFISPWVIGFAFGPTGAAPANGAATFNNVASTAAWDAWVVAVIVAVLSIAAISQLAVWEEWVNLVVGVWLFFSPWILGYAGLHAAMWNSLVVGFLIAVVAIWGIMAARRVAMPLERIETEPRSRL